MSPMTATIVCPGVTPVRLASPEDIPEPILAVAQLRQGAAPSRLAMLSGFALLELCRPRRSKTLPRYFAILVTEQRVLFYKSWGSGEDDDFVLHLRGSAVAEFPRSSVHVEDGAALVVNGERIPVFCPNMTNGGDPDAKATLELLAA